MHFNSFLDHNIGDVSIFGRCDCLDRFSRCHNGFCDRNYTFMVVKQSVTFHIEIKNTIDIWLFLI